MAKPAKLDVQKKANQWKDRPVSPFRAAQKTREKWQCASCGARNSYEASDCRKCHELNPNLSQADRAMQQTQLAPRRMTDFLQSSKYLKETAEQWQVSMVGAERTLHTMQQESSMSPCKYSLEECPCAQRAVFIQNLYRKWCNAHQQHSLQPSKMPPQIASSTTTVMAPETGGNINDMQFFPATPSPKKMNAKNNKAVTTHHSRQKTTSFADENKKRREKNRSKRTKVTKHSIAASDSLAVYGQNLRTLSIAEIIEQVLANYNKTQLIDDCNHIDAEHCHDLQPRMASGSSTPKNFAVFEFFKAELGECNRNCNIFHRANRDRLDDAKMDEKRDAAFYRFASSHEDVAVITTLDTFHTFWFHSQQLYGSDVEQSFIVVENFDAPPPKDNSSKTSPKKSQKQKPKPKLKNNMSGAQKASTSKFVTEADGDTATIGNFQFGEHFEYWAHYAKYDNYVAPCFSTLMEELLQNGIAPLAKPIFDDLNAKCELMMQASIVKKMSAMKNYYNEIANIREGDPITKEHLLSVMIYTNLGEIQKKFKQTMRMSTQIKLQPNDDASSGIYDRAYRKLKTDNSQIAIWCRLLAETVRLWGTIMTDKDKFWHGIDCPLLFHRFHASFPCPISTSSDPNVAAKFRNTEGIMIKLSCSSEKSMIPFFDVSRISDFRMESERLFYGADLNIVDLVYQNNKLDLIVRTLSLFQSIVSGGYFTHNSKLLHVKNQKRLVALIDSLLKYYKKDDLIISTAKTTNSKPTVKNVPSAKKQNDRNLQTQNNNANSDAKNDDVDADTDEENNESKFEERPPMKVKSIDIRNMSPNIKPRPSLKLRKSPIPLSMQLDAARSSGSAQSTPVARRDKRVLSFIMPKGTDRKYHEKLFDFSLASYQYNEIWLCRSEILGTATNKSKLITRLQKYFLQDKDTFGNFLTFWMKKWTITPKFSQEFMWNVGVDTFLQLPHDTLLASPKFIYLHTDYDHSTNCPKKIQFQAQCGRCTSEDPQSSDFYFYVVDMPQNVEVIQVTLDACCQLGGGKKGADEKGKNEQLPQMISHDPYEGELMSKNNATVASYFGGKSFEFERELCNDNGQHKLDHAYMRWKMAVRVVDIWSTQDIASQFHALPIDEQKDE